MVFFAVMKTPVVLTAWLAAWLVFLPKDVTATERPAGCGTVGIGNGTYTMEHAGLTRTYRVHLPGNYDANSATPLVLLFHGWGGDENEFLDDEIVRSEADRRGYIVAAPRGLGSGDPDNANNSWSFSGSTTGMDGDSRPVCDPGLTPDYSYESCAAVRKNSCSWTHCQADDIDFSITLVEELKDRLCVDEERIFASGGSNGGMFTWELGQNPKSAPVFRAIAPIIGLPHRGYLAGPGRDGDMPALLITGMLDNVVPPGAWDDDSFTTTSNDNDRYYYTGATAITRSWARAHGCDAPGTAAPVDVEFQIPDCRTFCPSDSGLPRVLDCRAQMGHVYELSWAWKLVMDFFDRS